MVYPLAFTDVVHWLPMPIIRLCRCLLLSVEAKMIVDISRWVKVDPVLEEAQVQEQEPALLQAQPHPTQLPPPMLRPLHLQQLVDEKAEEVEEVGEEIKDGWGRIYFRLPE